MKNILKIILILLFVNCKAQTQTVVNINTYNSGNNSNKYFKDINNNYANFVGTWENTTGNITFRLEIWKVIGADFPNETNSKIDLLNARYKIIQNAGTSTEVILYDSVKYFPQNGNTSDNIVLAFALNGNSFSGHLTDTCANGGNGVLDASFGFEILNLGNTPLQAHWRVKSNIELQPNESFTVPTDTVLTKMN